MTQHYPDFQDLAQLNVVIMAGGKGTRLQAMTAQTPKSLIPISDRPVIDHLIKHLRSFGVTSLHISVGHLAENIMEYLGSGGESGMDIQYIYETAPMGSIGSINLKADWKYDNFLVINGDILTDFNLECFVAQFFAKGADMAVLTRQNELDIPWGVLTVSEEGSVTSLVEKPRYSYVISAGIYLFRKEITALLPSMGPAEGWQLVHTAIQANRRVVSVPFDGSYWIDIGTKETLQQAIDLFSHHNSLAG